MVQARGKVTRSTTPQQVHLILRLKDLDYPFLIRFKSPDTISDALAANHRKRPKDGNMKGEIK